MPDLGEEPKKKTTWIMKQIITGLLETDKSTTRYIESIAGKRLKVKTLFQRGMEIGGERRIVRYSMLYVADDKKPIILSISEIQSNVLLEENLKKLYTMNIPIGDIFKKQRISKDNIPLKLNGVIILEGC